MKEFSEDTDFIFEQIDEKLDVRSINEALDALGPQGLENISFYRYDDGFEIKVLATVRNHELSDGQIKEIFDDWWEYMHSV